MISAKTTKRLQKRYGKWVLITGATSGIGYELSKALASAGFNLVLTGRREAILAQMKSDLSADNGVEIQMVTGDLSKEADVNQLIKKCAEIPIGTYILNAGYATSGNLIDNKLSDELNMFDLNARALLLLSHTFGNELKHKKRKGALVLLSSMVAFQGVPNITNYAATKAYVQSLGEGLYHELKPYDIDVLNVAPGPVNTGFADRASMEMGNAVDAKNITPEIISAIGRKKTVIPGGLAKFLVYNLRLLPRSIKTKIVGKVMKESLS